jgi:carboxyl-terminal processing protease
MKNQRVSLLFIPILFVAICAPQLAIAQAPTAAEWSSRIWAAASDGNWATVDSLLNQVPVGNEDSLVSFRNQLESYRSHKDKQSLEIITARDEALVEMKTCMADGKTLQAMQLAVKVQTLSRTLDDVMFNEDVQAIILQTQKEIDSLSKNGNILTAQTLLFYLRTFYEGTSRNDKYEHWDKKLDEVNIRVAILRQYAPEHYHGLFSKRAELFGDIPPQAYNEQASNNWIERIDGIETSIVVRSLDIATSEHMSNVSWESLITGGLHSVKKLGENPVISETFSNANDVEKQSIWLQAVDEELQSCSEYLLHISGKRVLIQILSRLLDVNDNAMELPQGVILREFGDGAMAQLDRYSSIIWPDESRHFEQQTEGRFVGVGIVIRESKSGEIMVTNPIEGSPAYYGGVQPEDTILAVNGNLANGWSLNDAVDRITGPRGTAVTLTVRREGEDKPIDIMLTRDTIKLHSVQGWWKKSLDEEGQPNWDWFIDKNNRIGYIRLTGFSEDTFSDTLRAIQEMQEHGQPNGLIVDLRYNPGGLLPTARRIANLFVNSGTIVSGETAAGEELFRMRAQPNRAYLSDWPVVILINQSSASASEIVAGCVQAHNAGIIVGKRSWGKGSVQTVHQIARDANVKLTTQYYRLPSADGGETPGRLVHKIPGSTDWGVLPDVEVEMTVEQGTQSRQLRREADMIVKDSNDERPDIHRLITDGLDPQLETALLLLRANALSRVISEHRHARNTISEMIAEQQRANRTNQ